MSLTKLFLNIHLESVSFSILLVGSLALWFYAVFNPRQGYCLVSPLHRYTQDTLSNILSRFGYSFVKHYDVDENESKSTLNAKVFLTWLISLVLLVETLQSFKLFGDTYCNQYYNSMLVSTPLVQLMKLLVLVLALFCVIFANIKEHGINRFTFSLIGGSLFFMVVMVSSNNFIVLYIAIEGLGLLLFTLAAQLKTATAVESGLKYFFQSSLASIFLLLGISRMYYSTGHLNFVDIGLHLTVSFNDLQ